jgi:arylsulfatase A-like enzyme
LDVAAKQPNIVVFFWDNFGLGEIGCYGGGLLRGAPTPRIDCIGDHGLKLLNFNLVALVGQVASGQRCHLPHIPVA